MESCCIDLSNVHLSFVNTIFLQGKLNFSLVFEKLQYKIKIYCNNFKEASQLQWIVAKIEIVIRK